MNGNIIMNCLHSFCFLPFHAFRCNTSAKSVRYISLLPISEHNEKQCAQYYSDLYKKLLDMCSKTKDVINNMLPSSAIMDYYDYPGIICERFKKLLDPREEGYIQESAFIHAMTTLSIGGIQEKLKFVFQIIDFDNDGSISKEDIKTILLHIPVAESNVKIGIRPTLSEPALMYSHQSDEIIARRKAQENIINFLKIYFENDFISYEEFETCTFKRAADVFINIIYILIQKQPTLSEVYMSEIKNAGKYQFKVQHKEIELKISSFLQSTLPFIEITHASNQCMHSTKISNSEDENIIDNEEIKINSLKSIKFNSNDIQFKNQINNRLFKTPKPTTSKNTLLKLRSRSFTQIAYSDPSQALHKNELSTRDVRSYIQGFQENCIICSDSSISQYYVSDSIMEGKLSEKIGEDIVESYYILRSNAIYSIMLNRN